MSYGPKTYDKNLFHRMVEEMYRMAEGGSDVDKKDIDLAIESVAWMAANSEYRGIICYALSVAACMASNDMGVMTYELHDAKAELVGALMDEAGYEYIVGDDHALFVKNL